MVEKYNKATRNITRSHKQLDGVSNHQPTEPFIKAHIKEYNIKAPRHWPLCEEFTGDRTKGQ